ncbi:kinesin family protein [Skeletonema marinoi]|uniref:Kinesin-like protein n=1 Tax=Skeletonema marinoi TaxID=267567 RepID=A0AAD8XZ99_9STRA|nr:kinesin family protein [Skeletonema marinoi]
MASKSSSANDGSAIQVVVRLRPMNEREQRHGTVPVISAKTKEKVVTVVKGKGRKQLKSSYSFDNVFTAFSSQEEVFEETVKPVIADVMRGYESTVFAYGQTGTGKTHTMEGSLERPELYGVIPRSAQAIFECLKQPQYKEHVVKCSYLEIYNEELRDLLVEGKNSHRAKLDIMECKDGGTFCRGLTEMEVRSASDVLRLIQRGQHQRMIGETKMNKASSRSHSLFTIQVDGKISLIDGDGDFDFTGKLHMVDLAGSECAKSAGNDKSAPEAVARERERMNINRSLLTLGRVITILKEKSLHKNVNARIPYRDSKLTRVLQESLGGRCKTVVVATISPSITAIEESVSTLNYAQSACGIVNKPFSSSSIAFGEMPNFSDKKSSGECNIESWQEMEMRLQYMQTQVDEAQAALARKHIQQQELQEKVEKAEEKLLVKQKQLYDAEKENKALKGVVETETRKRKEAETDLYRRKLI